MLTNKTFDEYWEAQHASKQWGKYPNELLVKFLMSRFRDLEARKSAKVLEIGCGSGANIWFVANEGFQAYAIDASKSAVSNAVSYLSNQNLKANVVVGDACKLHEVFPDEEFDVIFDICTFCHIPISQSRQAFRDVYSRLKKGGYFFSIGFQEGTAGYGTGELIEFNTYAKPTDGPLKDIGIVHFTSLGEVAEINSAMYSSLSVDEYSVTLNNRSQKVKYLITQAQK